MGPGTAITAVSNAEKSLLTTMITYHCNTVVMFVRLALTLFVRPSSSVLTCTDTMAIPQYGIFASKYFLVHFSCLRGLM